MERAVEEIGRELNPRCARSSRPRASCWRATACASARSTTWRCCGRWASATASRTTRASSTAACPATGRTACWTTSPRTSSASSTSPTRRCRRSAACTRATARASRRSSTTASGCPARWTTGRRPSTSSSRSRRRCCSSPPRRASTSARTRARVVEQIVRPTGIVDPQVDVRETRNQIDDLMNEVRERVDRNERVLVTTLTKKMSEDLTDYLLEMGFKVRYLHSEVDTLERIQIIRDLRLGEYDVLVGVNLLREGLDLPEVSLVAILDADKEGFLRGETSLIQTIGRAARNVDGKVIMYADKETAAMKAALAETDRRRAIQLAYNEEHGITAASIVKGISDIAEFLQGDSKTPKGAPAHASAGGQGRGHDAERAREDDHRARGGDARRGRGPALRVRGAPARRDPRAAARPDRDLLPKPRHDSRGDERRKSVRPRQGRPARRLRQPADERRPRSRPRPRRAREAEPRGRARPRRRRRPQWLPPEPRRGRAARAAHVGAAGRRGSGGVAGAGRPSGRRPLAARTPTRRYVNRVGAATLDFFIRLGIVARVRRRRRDRARGRRHRGRGRRDDRRDRRLRDPPRPTRRG